MPAAVVVPGPNPDPDGAAEPEPPALPDTALLDGVPTGTSVVGRAIAVVLAAMVVRVLVGAMWEEKMMMVEGAEIGIGAVPVPASALVVAPGAEGVVEPTPAAALLEGVVGVGSIEIGVTGAVGVVTGPVTSSVVLATPTMLVLATTTVLGVGAVETTPETSVVTVGTVVAEGGALPPKVFTQLHTELAAACTRSAVW